MSSKDKLRTLKTSSKDTQDIELPSTSFKDPSAPTTLKTVGPTVVDSEPAEPKPKRWWKRCWIYMYDADHNLFCGRTCASWWYMIIYAVMYMIFLSTYMMVFLYATLTIIKMTEVYNVIEKPELMTYSDNGIGLTAAPLLDSVPLISYEAGKSQDYRRYVRSLDEFMSRRRKSMDLTDLGPCGTSPYGYGDAPCIILRLNKQIGWSAKPMEVNTTKDIPNELRNWLRLKDQKLWLHCDGYHSYDKEHIGRIYYHPYPPGFDPKAFPLDMRGFAPLIAVQISNFTLGLSLAVECNLWYDAGVSSITFVLYVGHNK